MLHEWHGARGTMHEGVFVTESDLPGESLGPITVSIGLQNATSINSRIGWLGRGPASGSGESARRTKT